MASKKMLIPLLVCLIQPKRSHPPLCMIHLLIKGKYLKNEEIMTASRVTMMLLVLVMIMIAIH